MHDDIISLISYLTLSELDSIKARLNSHNIKYIVNGHGARSRYHSAYYEIRVRKKDYKKAKGIADRFRAETFLKSRKCPKCGSRLYESVSNLNFFQKLLYLGTTPVKCKKCGNKYFI